MGEDRKTTMNRADQQSFDSIFNSNYEELVRVAYSLVSDLDIAEDMVQEVFIKFWERKMDIKIEKTIYGYLKKAVVFHSIDYLRKSKRIDEHIVNHQHTSLQLNLQTPEAELLTKENLRAIYDKIEELPERSKQVFKLSRFEEFSYAEIAEQLNISVKTVEYHISRALELLRKSVFGLLIIGFMEAY